MSSEKQNDVALEVLIETAESLNIELPDGLLNKIYQLEKVNQYNPKDNTVNEIKKMITDAVEIY